MEFRDALKMLRGELGLTQMELANALHVNFSTIGRWENGRTLPNRALAAALIEFARARSVSYRCAEGLKQAIQNVAKSKLDFSGSNLYAVEHASLSEIIDSAAFPIYVCDLETDDILYINRKAEDLIGSPLTELSNRKCYRCIMHRDAPCDFCNKGELVEERFISYQTQQLPNGKSYHVQGKRIQWSGHDAQIRYIVNDEPSEQLQAIIENINGGVSVVVYASDGSVRLAYANDHYYSIFGYTKEQYRAELKGAQDTVFPEDAAYVRAVIQKVKAEHQAVSFKYRIIKRDRSIAHVRCSSSITKMESLGGMVMISVITDITASEKIEWEALINGQRLKAIMDNINNGVVATVLDDSGEVNYVFVTDGYYEMLGFTREQYQREVADPFSLICAEDREEVKKAAINLRNADGTKTLTYRVTRRDGRMIWVKVDITVMAFTDVDTPVQLSVFTDVTNAVDANEKLAAQKDQISELLNTTPGGIAIIEVNPKDVLGSLRTTYYNDSFFSYSGYSRQEYEALHRSNEMHFVFEEDAPLLFAAAKKMFAGEIGTTADASVRCHTRDGGYRWMLFTGQLVERRGELCVIHIVRVDITKRKEAEDKQRINEEMLRVAAETDKRAIVLYNVKANTCHVESRMLFSSQFGESISNIPEALIDTGIVSKEAAAELRSLFDRIHKGEPNTSASLLMRTSADEYQWFECNASVVFDADGHPDHAVLVFHNITEQRIKEAVFTKWKQSIEQRPIESYTLFRCNLSKDARLDQQDGTLLKIVFSSDDMAFNQRTREYVERYVYPEDSEKYIALLDSDTLLAMFYRNEHVSELEYREMDENGALSWRRLTVELVEYLNSSDVQAFLLYEDIDEKKRAELREKELAETDPLTSALNRVAFSEKAVALIGDEPGTQHALIMMDMDGFKLLNDRFGHAAGDQALIDVAATLRSLTREGDLVCRLGGDEFVIWLRNIPYDAVIDKIAKQISEQVRKAFSAEVQISASLGIAVYPRDGHDFDELYHKADKALYNVKRAGKGSYAFFSVADEAHHPDPSYSVAKPRPVPQTAVKVKRRMLVVDDNETNRILLQQLFKDEYLIETAKNGTEAMIRLRHFGASISVVLLDLVMPGMDGFEVLERMQNNTELRAIPVIIVSGDERHETLLRAIDNGAADYVIKPVDNDVIRIRVRSAVSKAENERLRAQNSYLQLQREEELKFRTVLESTGTVVVEYDWSNHVFIYDNTISNYIAGSYSNRSLWTVFLSDMVAGSDDVKAMQETVMSLANNREASKASRLVKLNTPANAKHWFRMNVYKQVDDFGLAEKMIITFNDIHEEVLTSDRLQYQATHDELTGLYNRAGFIEQAQKLVSRKEPGHYVMACIDIDKFKVINDQYGTQKGDEVLRSFAEVLLQINGGKDCVCCRIMADNFAVLYPQRLANALELIKVHRAAEQLDGSLPPLKMYVGRCVVDDPTLPISAIYDRAFIAKDTVKGRYDEYIATYDESCDFLLCQSDIKTNDTDIKAVHEYINLEEDTIRLLHGELPKLSVENNTEDEYLEQSAKKHLLECRQSFVDELFAFKEFDALCEAFHNYAILAIHDKNDADDNDPYTLGLYRNQKDAREFACYRLFMKFLDIFRESKEE